MITDVKINGAFVAPLKRSLVLNSRMGSRISTASLDILGEEHFETPALSCMPQAVAFGGYTHPYVKNEIKIDRAPTPLVNCATVPQVVAMGGNSKWLDNFFGGYIATKEIRTIGKRRFYRLTAQDYNILPVQTQIPIQESYVAQTDLQIITDLFSTYLSEVDYTTYVEDSGVPITIDWTRIPLEEALDELAAISTKEWYIDHTKYLHYFTPVTTEAPFELSSSPGLTTKIGYNSFRYLEDATKLLNRVIVVGDPGVPVLVTRTDAPSFAKYGRYFDGKIVDSNIDTAAWANLRGDAELATYAFERVWGRLICNQEGLVVGQKVKIYNHRRGVDDYYLIQVVTLSMVNYFTEQVMIEYGDFSPNLIDLLGKIKKEAVKES